MRTFTFLSVFLCLALAVFSGAMLAEHQSARETMAEQALTIAGLEAQLRHQPPPGAVTMTSLEGLIWGEQMIWGYIQTMAMENPDFADVLDQVPPRDDPGLQSIELAQAEEGRP